MLGPCQENYDLVLSFVKDRNGERGGIVSYLTSSGVSVATYAESPIGAKPLGIQLNDVEYMNLSRQYHPSNTRRVDRAGTTVGLCADGKFDTNFIHPLAAPYSGKKAYLGPSGLITDDISFGGDLIGFFLSELNDRTVPGLPTDILPITIYGGGYSRSQVFTMTQDGPTITSEGDPETTLVSPGWCRVKIAIN